MIFDSPRLIKLRKQYADSRPEKQPWIVLLASMPHFEGERLLLEQLLAECPEDVRSDILSKLLSQQYGQQLGAWFQLMLFDWLQQEDLGEVRIDPIVHQSKPDFILDDHNPPIIIEARARQKLADLSIVDDRQHEVHQVLSSIQLPYLITVEIEQLQGKLLQSDLRLKVAEWLGSNPEKGFHYSDESGNMIVMDATFRPDTECVAVIMSSPAIWISGVSLQGPISDKANQHQNLRNENFCYVIALYLADPYLSAEEVQEALFGQTVAYIDPITGTIVEERTNGKGVFYEPNGIRHRTVSGVLVFKSELDYYARRRYLRSWYIQNPYATSPIDPWYFPAESRFLIVEQNQTSFQMGWRTNKNQLDQT